MKKIAFLFDAKRRQKGRNYYFDVSDSGWPFLKRLLTPLTSYHRGINWSYIERERFMRKYSSSVFLRVFLQAEIVSRFKKINSSVACTTDRSIKDSVVVVHKWLVNDIGLLHTLKKNRNKILLDIIDGAADEASMSLADGLLCCSRKAYEYYDSNTHSCPVFFVEHCVDRRIPPFSGSRSQFKACYFGGIENFQVYEGVLERVTPHYSAVNFRPNLDWFAFTADASLHYAVRPELEEDGFKPFMKGFVAARCSANILVHADDGDAASYLGADYPYLITEPLDGPTVIRYLDKAASDFGGKRWNEALDVVARLREFTDEELIAAQFWNAVEDLR